MNKSLQDNKFFRNPESQNLRTTECFEILRFLVFIGNLFYMDFEDNF